MAENLRVDEVPLVLGLLDFAARNKQMAIQQEQSAALHVRQMRKLDQDLQNSQMQYQILNREYDIAEFDMLERQAENEAFMDTLANKKRYKKKLNEYVTTPEYTGFVNKYHDIISQIAETPTQKQLQVKALVDLQGQWMGSEGFQMFNRRHAFKNIEGELPNNFLDITTEIKKYINSDTEVYDIMKDLETKKLIEERGRVAKERAIYEAQFEASQQKFADQEALVKLFGEEWEGDGRTQMLGFLDSITPLADRARSDQRFSGQRTAFPFVDEDGNEQVEYSGLPPARLKVAAIDVAKRWLNNDYVYVTGTSGRTIQRKWSDIQLGDKIVLPRPFGSANIYEIGYKDAENLLQSFIEAQTTKGTRGRVPLEQDYWVRFQRTMSDFGRLVRSPAEQLQEDTRMEPINEIIGSYIKTAGLAERENALTVQIDLNQNGTGGGLARPRAIESTVKQDVFGVKNLDN